MRWHLAAAALALTLVVPALFFHVIAWGEWNCGLNPLQLTIADMLAAAGGSIGLAVARSSLPPERRPARRLLLLPWAVAVGAALWLAWGAPGCPFPGR